MNYLIIGGTGTLGKELTRQLLTDPKNHVICFSRCEFKQQEMKREFKNNPELRFIVGDMRDRESLFHAMVGVKTVFHVAALKHVDVLEDNPEESVKTNILGTINVCDAAIKCEVDHVVFSSTDKAVDPVNVYGMSKGISEKILLRRNEIQGITEFSVYRWGNVLGSRGSAIHSFADSLLNSRKVFLTDPEMSRFWIKIEDAVKFMLAGYQTAALDDINIPSMKAASVIRVIHTIARILSVDKFGIEPVGLRRGEKIHEAMRSMHDHRFFDSKGSDQYTDLELEQLIYPVLKAHNIQRKEGVA